jgi:hypothetical protein
MSRMVVVVVVVVFVMSVVETPLTHVIACMRQGFDITHGRYDTPCHEPGSAAVVVSVIECEVATAELQ